MRHLPTPATHGAALAPLTPLVMASRFGNRHTHGREATHRVDLYKRHTSNTIHIRLRDDFSFPKTFTVLTTSRALQTDTDT